MMMTKEEMLDVIYDEIADKRRDFCCKLKQPDKIQKQKR
jgi:hypothetical protein